MDKEDCPAIVHHHVAEFVHGGPIILTVFRNGWSDKTMSFTREQLWQLKIEIERWFDGHSGICHCCGTDQGKHPNEQSP